MMTVSQTQLIKFKYIGHGLSYRSQYLTKVWLTLDYYFDEKNVFILCERYFIGNIFVTSCKKHYI